MREDTGPMPSARAAQRLANDVGAEVADLRGSLRRALDEADRLQAVGRTDLAAEVLEDQRETLAAVHQQLAERLAAAAVEREAEHIVEVAAQPAEAAVAPPPIWDATVVRLVASAAAAIAGVALLFVPDLGPGMLEAAGLGGTEDTAPAETVSDATPTADDAAPHPTTQTQPTAVVPPTSHDSASDGDDHGSPAGGAVETSPVPSPDPQPDPAGLSGVVDDVTEGLLGPLVERAGTDGRSEDTAEASSGDEAADDDSSDAPWADVDLDGSSAE